MRIRLVLTACSALAGACQRPSNASSAMLDVEWRGSDQGHFASPLTATHCPESGIVELTAIRGDTGVAFALFPPDSARLAASDYVVFPGTNLLESRPGATAGVRWFSGIDLITYEGRSGRVTLTPDDSLVSGKVEVRLQALTGTDTLRLTGRFTGVPVTRLGPGCGRTVRRNLI